MAAIAIPTRLQHHIPDTIDPSQIWVNYNSKIDSLIVYFTEKPMPTIWDDIDEHTYIGFAENDETLMTGVMIEQFSKWLFDPNMEQPMFQPV